MPKSSIERKVLDRLNKFPQLEVLHNTRPNWLIGSKGERLELDFYLPQLAIAIEVQGEQHARFVPHFHKEYQGFKDQKRRDDDKARTCENVGITILEIWSSSEIDDALNEVKVAYSHWVNMPSSKNAAYRLIFAHMLAIWKKPKRAQEEQRYALIKLVATEWGISLKEIMGIFEPQFKEVLKMAVKFQDNGLRKQRHVNTIRRMATTNGMSEQQIDILTIVIPKTKY